MREPFVYKKIYNIFFLSDKFFVALGDKMSLYKKQGEK